MKYKTIIFTYDGYIGKNYGVDGTALVAKGIEYTPNNIKDENIAKIWVREGFAEYKTGETKKEVKSEQKEPEYKDVPKKELDNEPSLTSGKEIEEIQLEVEEVSKPKKTWSPCKEVK